jgi:hypothetical protein
MPLSQGSFQSPGAASTTSVSGLSFAPKIVIIWGAYTTVLDTAGSNSYIDLYGTYGFARKVDSSTSEYACIGWSAESAPDSGNSNCGSCGSNAAVLWHVDYDQNTLEKATISAWASDGFTVSFSTSSSAHYYHYFAIGGDEIQATIKSNAVKTDASDDAFAHSLGVAPDFILSLASAVVTSADGTAGGYEVSIGFHDGTTTACVGGGGMDAQSASNTARIIFNNRWGTIDNANINSACAMSVDATNVNYEWSDGTVGNTPDDAYYMHFLAITGLDNVEVGTDLGADTTTKAHTVDSFTPEGVLLGASYQTSENSLSTWSQLHLGAITSSAEGCISTVDRDAVASGGQNYHESDDDSGLAFIKADGTHVGYYEYYSFESGSFTLNYTTDHSTRYSMFAALDTPSDTSKTIQTRGPTEDDYAIAWTASAGNPWECVDDPVLRPNDDTDYIYRQDSNNYHLFTFPAFSISSSSITGVTIHVRAKRTAVGNADIKGILRVNGTNYEGFSESATTSWVDYSYEWTTNPNTASAWAEGDVEGAGSNPIQAFGVNTGLLGAGEEMRVTQVYLRVEYTEPTGGTEVSILGVYELE